MKRIKTTPINEDKEEDLEKDSIIKLLHNQRKHYEQQQKFHYNTFAAYILILLLDFVIIIYTRLITLNGYAWAGIVFLFALLFVEAIQYNKFKELKESVDDFYMKGEYGE